MKNICFSYQKYVFISYDRIVKVWPMVMISYWLRWNKKERLLPAQLYYNSNPLGVITLSQITILGKSILFGIVSQKEWVRKSFPSGNELRVIYYILHAFLLSGKIILADHHIYHCWILVSENTFFCQTICSTLMHNL